MPIVIDYTRMFPVFDRQAVESYRKKIAGLHAGLVERRRGGELPFYDLPSQDVSDILRFARERKERFDNIVVLGIGGSALGLISLDAALRSPYG
jgi:glucose-6-phosphate isomerase